MPRIVGHPPYVRSVPSEVFKPAAAGNPAERDKTYTKAARDTSIDVKELKPAAGDAKVVKASHKLSADESTKVIQSIATSENVASVEPDILMQPASTPNDTYYPQQWALSDPNVGIRVSSVWDKTTGTGQIVAVIDTGITAHSNLNANVIAGYDMITGTAGSRDSDGRDADASDPGDYRAPGDCGSTSTSTSSWHGTHVAGIIAAVANNGEGVTGAAPGSKSNRSAPWAIVGVTSLTFRMASPGPPVEPSAAFRPMPTRPGPST